MKFRLSIVILSIFCTAFVVGQQRVDEFSESGESLSLPDAVNYATEGVKSRNLFGDTKRAKELLFKAIESDSTYAPAHYALADMLMFSSADSAYHHAKSAYMLDTTNTWYLSAYAQASAMMEHFEESEYLYQRLLELQPRNVNAYRVLAIVYNQQKRPLEAVSLLDSAEFKIGRNPYLVDLKRQILLSNNHTDRVIEDAKAVVADEPYSIEARVTLAELYRDSRQDSLAMQSYSEAMQMDSTRLQTLFSLGDFLFARGDIKGYINILRSVMSSDNIDLGSKMEMVQRLIDDRDMYQREHIAIGTLITALIAKYPNNEAVVEMQTKHLIALGMLDEALIMLKSHLNIDPPSLKTYRTVIDIERYKERVDSVELYLNRAIKLFPEEEDLPYEWAYTLTMQRRYDEAISLYEEHLVGASDSLSSSLWGIIGDIHHQVAISDTTTNSKLFKKRMKMSYKAYDKALSYTPNNAMVLNNYAYFICEYGGNLEQARKMSKLSTELDPSNPTLIDTYAWILYRLGEYEEARVQMRRAISLDTTQNGEIALHYGEILAVLGEMTMANHYWGKALEWGMSEDQVEASRKAAAAQAAKLSK